jgi:hypothetical protein
MAGLQAVLVAWLSLVSAGQSPSGTSPNLYIYCNTGYSERDCGAQRKRLGDLLAGMNLAPTDLSGRSPVHCQSGTEPDVARQVPDAARPAPAVRGRPRARSCCVPRNRRSESEGICRAAAQHWQGHLRRAEMMSSNSERNAARAAWTSGRLSVRPTRFPIHERTPTKRASAREVWGLRARPAFG